MVRKRISIIVPCYNQSQYLAETLDSVLAQSYTDWECIVINDGSTDETEAVAMRYAQKDNRFKYTYQDNQGVSVARNNAIGQSVGEFILPLDGDDKIGPTYIEKALGIFEENPITKLVYCNAELFGAETGKWELPDYAYEDLIWSNSIFCSAVFRRTDFDKCGGFNPNMKEGYEDWDFWISFLNKEDVVHRLDETLFFYRIRSASRNQTAEDYKEKLFDQIYHNHVDVYNQYADRVFAYKQESLRWKEMYEIEHRKFDVCYHSMAYRMGKIILRPFSWVKRTIFLSN